MKSAIVNACSIGIIELSKKLQDEVRVAILLIVARYTSDDDRINVGVTPQHPNNLTNSCIMALASHIRFTGQTAATVNLPARPNLSLNRTHCGGTSFGLEKPSPNASPPQWAG